MYAFMCLVQNASSRWRWLLQHEPVCAYANDCEACGWINFFLPQPGVSKGYGSCISIPYSISLPLAHSSLSTEWSESTCCCCCCWTARMNGQFACLLFTWSSSFVPCSFSLSSLLITGERETTAHWTVNKLRKKTFFSLPVFHTAPGNEAKGEVEQ